MTNHALRVPADVPVGITHASWGALCDLASVGLQPSARLGAQLVALGLVVEAGTRLAFVARAHSEGSVARRRELPKYEITDEGRRVAQRAPSSVTGDRRR